MWHGHYVIAGAWALGCVAMYVWIRRSSVGRARARLYGPVYLATELTMVYFIGLVLHAGVVMVVDRVTEDRNAQLSPYEEVVGALEETGRALDRLHEAIERDREIIIQEIRGIRGQEEGE